MRIPDWSPARKAQPKSLAHAESQYFANSEATVLALIEAFCSAVARAAQGSIKAAARLADTVLPWLHGSVPSTHGWRCRKAVVSKTRNFFETIKGQTVTPRQHRPAIASHGCAGATDTAGMYRGWARVGGATVTAMYAADRVELDGSAA